MNRRNWTVARVHDDGRAEVVRDKLEHGEAEDVAGQMRDAMSDREVGAGWNYVARRAGKQKRTGQLIGPPVSKPVKKPKAKAPRRLTIPEQIAALGLRFRRRFGAKRLTVRHAPAQIRSDVGGPGVQVRKRRPTQ